MTAAKQSTKFALAVLLGLSLAPCAQAKDDSTTYRCHTKDAVSILNDGTMNKIVGDVAKKDFDKVVIDVATGHVTFPATAKRQEWLVEKADVDDGEYVLYPRSARERGHTIANAVTNYIRIRAAKSDPQPRYMVVTLSYIVTGTCELLK